MTDFNTILEKNYLARPHWNKPIGIVTKSLILTGLSKYIIGVRKMCENTVTAAQMIEAINMNTLYLYDTRKGPEIDEFINSMNKVDKMLINGTK